MFAFGWMSPTGLRLGWNGTPLTKIKREKDTDAVGMAVANSASAVERNRLRVGIGLLILRDEGVTALAGAFGRQKKSKSPTDSAMLFYCAIFLIGAIRQFGVGVR